MTQPDKRDVQAYYDARVDGKLRDFTEPNPRIEVALATVSEWAPPSPRRILEIGCGVGATSWRMARAWPEAEVIGADISEASIKVAQTCFKRPNLQYRAGPVKTGVIEGKFDLILMMDVYEHISGADRTEVHAALDSLLSDEGRLILAFPTPAYQKHLLDNAPHELQPVDEDVGVDEVARLSKDTHTKVAYYRHTGVWNYGDYAHLVLTRGHVMPPVKIREYVHPSRIVRLKGRVKTLLGRGQKSAGLRDYFGADLPARPFDTSFRFGIPLAERKMLADSWFKTRGGA